MAAGAKVERRFVQGLEFRAAGEGTKGTIGTLFGYAAVFNKRSEDLGGFVEIVKPGAFTDTLKRGDDVRCLVQHLSMLLLGRRSAKTLELVEDEKGLRYDVQVPDTQAGRDLVVSVERRDLTGSSFGFRTIDDRWFVETNGGKEIVVRELIKADLFDVGPVTYPAYTDTSAEIRALSEILEDGKRRLSTDAQARLSPERRARRDRLIQLHKRRVGVWTG